MARLAGAMQCIKCMLFLLNFMFMLLGVLLVSMGAAILTNYYDFDIFLKLSHFKPAEILIACGAILIVVSLIGCVGAVKESTAAINFFALLLFLVLVLEIGGTITAFAMHCDIYGDVESNMKTYMGDYKRYGYARNGWDYIQEHLQCCGIHHPRDWEKENIDGPVVNVSNAVFTVPYSCCEDSSKCRRIYGRGCLDLLSRYVTDSMMMMVYIGIGVGSTQLLSVIFACTLAKGIRRAKTEMEMERQQNQHRAYEQAIRSGRGTTFFPMPTSTDA